jgi:hypothetical protein
MAESELSFYLVSFDNRSSDITEFNMDSKVVVNRFKITAFYFCLLLMTYLYLNLTCYVHGSVVILPLQGDAPVLQSLLQCPPLPKTKTHS